MNAEFVMNLETVLVALIVSVIAPAVLAYITGRQRRLDKIEDYKRQDRVAEMAAAVAERVAIVADVQRATATEASIKLSGVAEKVATVAEVQLATAKEASSKLEQIHILVNSNVTALMQAELDGLVRESTLLATIAAGNISAKRKVDPGVKMMQGITDKRVAMLQEILAVRKEQTELADAVRVAEEKGAAHPHKETKNKAHHGIV